MERIDKIRYDKKWKDKTGLDNIRKHEISLEKTRKVFSLSQGTRKKSAGSETEGKNKT